MNRETEQENIADRAVAEGGAYEIIRKRLEGHGETLEDKVRTLNDARVAEFGSNEMSVVSRTRVRTENNCVGRDIVQVGNFLLFGYNVFIGLRKSIRVEDVFSLSKISLENDHYTVTATSSDGTLLADPRFISDFEELYQYYADARLVQLVVKQETLLASFQIGERLDDLRVFRWRIKSDSGEADYIDNRGERDVDLPSPWDFEWIQTGRDNIVHGRQPHVNILDELFIDTLGGNLTVRIEDNTEGGQGAWRESVEAQNQSLDDTQFHYARHGNLILVKILPYKEDVWRYLVYNKLTSDVVRIDSIGDSCVTLPEDHGIIFPEGYYLESGEHKSFDLGRVGFRFKRRIRSPNGEDVLFVFYEPYSGSIALLAYNLIDKTLQNPIVSHGYALAADGTMAVFTAQDEATRVHPMQFWQTPFVDIDFASEQPVSQSFYSRIGNAELVRGISELYSVCREIEVDEPSTKHYEGLHRRTQKIFDSYFWVDDESTAGIGESIRAVAETTELIIDEFEKVQAIRRQSAQAVKAADAKMQQLLLETDSSELRSIDDFVGALNGVKQQRGHLTTIRDYRYIDTDRIAQIDAQLVQRADQLSEQAAQFLMRDDAFDAYSEKIDAIDTTIVERNNTAQLTPDLEQLEQIAGGLDLLTELVSTLEIQDATVRTQIIQTISDVYSGLNQTRARGRQHLQELGSTEKLAGFGAQLRLFSQSITNGLGLATSPQRCDQQLARMLVQLEELESQYGEQAQFLSDIADKREEAYNAFEQRKQQLLDDRHSRAQTLSDAAARMLENIERRTKRLQTADELNTYLASDTLVVKVREIIDDLRELNNTVKADDTQAQLKLIHDQAHSALRDKTDLYEDDGKVIKLGPQHQFNVNSEELDLTLIARDGRQVLHLVGTQYFEPIDDDELNGSKAYWDLSLESESPDVYRGEYLAYLILDAAMAGADGLDWPRLLSACDDPRRLEGLVTKFATPRYKESYQRGVHDADAMTLLATLVPQIEKGQLLRFDPLTRGLAQLAWLQIKGGAFSNEHTQAVETLQQRSRSASQMLSIYGDRQAITLIELELGKYLDEFLHDHGFDLTDVSPAHIVEYLVIELGQQDSEIVCSAEADAIVTQFHATIDQDAREQFEQTIKSLETTPAQQWNVSRAWLRAFLAERNDANLLHYIPEAAACIIAGDRLSRRVRNVKLRSEVDGLFGQHPRIEKGRMSVALDEFLKRLKHHVGVVVPAYQRYVELRHSISANARKELRLDEFKPKPLSSFVRNKLINDAYLPIIGANLAKQIGTAGESRRSDLNGLLMMISPPGYGKTTLMEYVASRLGLTFMKINCPVIGHDTDSLDPASAHNATARQELHKLNLALKMGDNVMLYLDDIQHTGAEFLQKFISLCDSTRRIEGVWKDQTQTFDLRGRKFCVVMAGNPYTESGEMFRVPDMLANRADIYNLGDVLSGMESQFELSYIENCLTSNPILATLARREQSDVYKLIDRAQGREVATTELAHAYSGAEVSEICKVLENLFVIRDTILKVNREYIASAAQDDRYRVEPRFLLQGSYRNMNKLAEKVSAVMNEQEIDELINDHYRGEAQLLTQGTEANLLKLAELRGILDNEQQDRWEAIKKDFLREKALGGEDADAGMRISNQLADLVTGVDNLSDKFGPRPDDDSDRRAQSVEASINIGRSVERLSEAIASQKTVSIVNTPSEEFSTILNLLNETIEETLFPLVRTMDRRIALELGSQQKVQQLEDDVAELRRLTGKDD